MSLLERLLSLVIAILVVAALVLLIRHDIGRNAAPKSSPAAAAGTFGRFWWQ